MTSEQKKLLKHWKKLLFTILNISHEEDKVKKISAMILELLEAQKALNIEIIEKHKRRTCGADECPACYPFEKVKQEILNS